MRVVKRPYFEQGSGRDAQFHAIFEEYPERSIEIVLDLACLGQGGLTQPGTFGPGKPQREIRRNHEAGAGKGALERAILAIGLTAGKAVGLPGLIWSIIAEGDALPDAGPADGPADGPGANTSVPGHRRREHPSGRQGMAGRGLFRPRATQSIVQATSPASARLRICGPVAVSTSFHADFQCRVRATLR